jgi:hypothetical protein
MSAVQGSCASASAYGHGLAKNFGARKRLSSLREHSIARKSPLLKFVSMSRRKDCPTQYRVRTHT